jgi:uncharacterized protein
MITQPEKNESAFSLPKTDRPFFLSLENWIFIFLTLVSIVMVLRFVDLTPRIDKDFFFSTDDPLYQADHKISRLFVRKDSQIIINVAGNIYSPDYKDRIHRLCEMLLPLKDLQNVFSIMHGPGGLQKALRSPFWSRLLIPEDQKSTNIVILLNGSAASKIIPKVEEIIGVFEAADFRIAISGSPYVSHLIGRYLLSDLKTFSLLAFVIFGMVIIFVFHSWRLLTGMLLTCLNAGMITFMITNLLKIKVGVLTANLLTIVFVLTLEHIVFLTFNWQNLHRPENAKWPATKMAVHMTWQASFWCMFTTVLGFLSCVFVPAKPLKELGISGAIGTGIAFIAAYSIYPSFLRLKESSRLRADHFIKHQFHRFFSVLERSRQVLITGIVIFLLLAVPKLKSINVDPSLISYFSPTSKIAQGLALIDQSGGSSPLLVVVNDPTGQSLASNASYRRLWKLQEALEKHPETGVVLSLPTLMAEGKRSFFFFLYGWKRYFNKLEKPQYAQIGKSFISPDRRQGVFLIRMKELNRHKTRTAVVEEIKQIISQHHFTTSLVGGIYALEGRLSQLVASSLIYGLGRLIVIFFFIALLFSYSLWISLAVTVGITLIPVCILGGFGLWRIPLDIISAPASNVAIGIGIDAMIHMTAAFRRLRKKREPAAVTWDAVIKQMWEPIITSMLIMSMGFGIFFFSSFPPTRRFGLSIAIGTVIAAVTALFIFPLLAGGLRRRHKGHPPESSPVKEEASSGGQDFLNRIKR